MRTQKSCKHREKSSLRLDQGQTLKKYLIRLAPTRGVRVRASWKITTNPLNSAPGWRWTSRWSPDRHLRAQQLPFPNGCQEAARPSSLLGWGLLIAGHKGIPRCRPSLPSCGKTGALPSNTSQQHRTPLTQKENLLFYIWHECKRVRDAQPTTQISKWWYPSSLQFSVYTDSPSYLLFNSPFKTTLQLLFKNQNKPLSSLPPQKISFPAFCPSGAGHSFRNHRVAQAPKVQYIEQDTMEHTGNGA